MKRLFPAPWLSLALWALWLLLNLSLSAGNLLLGAALGFLGPLMMAPLRPLPIRIRRPGVIIKLFFLVGRDVILSNLAVAWGVLSELLRAQSFAAFAQDLMARHQALSATQNLDEMGGELRSIMLGIAHDAYAEQANRAARSNALEGLRRANEAIQRIAAERASIRMSE